MSKAPHLVVCVLLSNAQQKLFSVHKANFNIRNVERHFQKLKYRSDVTRWPGPSLPLAPMQSDQYCNHVKSLVVYVCLTESETKSCFPRFS